MSNGVLRPRDRPKVKYPLIRDLAADSVPVSVTCRALAFPLRPSTRGTRAWSAGVTGARRILAEALQAEIGVYIAQFADQRRDDNRWQLVHNGCHKSREVLTSASAIEVTVLRSMPALWRTWSWPAVIAGSGSDRCRQ